MAPPFLRFQTKYLYLWTFVGAQKSGQREDSILKMDNRFGSVGIWSSEIIYRFLYPNQWILVNKIRISAVHVYWDKLQKTTPLKTWDIIKYHNLPNFEICRWYSNLGQTCDTIKTGCQVKKISNLIIEESSPFPDNSNMPNPLLKPTLAAWNS
jgi:hypothetical protein